MLIYILSKICKNFITDMKNLMKGNRPPEPPVRSSLMVIYINVMGKVYNLGILYNSRTFYTLSGQYIRPSYIGQYR
jgi:hypothetical protein